MRYNFQLSAQLEAAISNSRDKTTELIIVKILMYARAYMLAHCVVGFQARNLKLCVL